MKTVFFNPAEVAPIEGLIPGSQRELAIYPGETSTEDLLKCYDLGSKFITVSQFFADRNKKVNELARSLHIPGALWSASLKWAWKIIKGEAQGPQKYKFPRKRKSFGYSFEAVAVTGSAKKSFKTYDKAFKFFLDEMLKGNKFFIRKVNDGESRGPAKDWGSSRSILECRA